ncbi:MAG: hypothetical protein KDA89_16465 [Planctomycetaceae bacterium]|nr:hypothetical protein [Planctomycetaceae bacterium]
MTSVSRGRLLSGQQVRLREEPVRVGLPPAVTDAEEHSPGGSHIEQVRDVSGNVTEIRVCCPCGHVTIIACDY